MTAGTGALRGVSVLVAGASGFLGSRLVERLVAECGASVRVLVRHPMSAAPLARFPVQITVGDVLDQAAVAAAAEGCRVIFNCTKGKGGDAAHRLAVDLDGVKNLLEAAQPTGARVVHVSTMAVYDRPGAGDFDESAPPVTPGDAYSDNKLAGEQLALELGSRLRVPVVVLQPTVVYGPTAGVYGADILRELHTHRVILVNGGTGICNAVYVDDVVTALLLASTNERAAGERFLVSGPQHPAWSEFFAAFERMLGASRTVSMTEDEAMALWRRSQRRRWLIPELLRVVAEDRVLRRRLLATKEGAIVRNLASRVLSDAARARLRARTTDPHGPQVAGALPIAAVRPWVVQNMARRARARIDKARRVLGYEPVFDLDAGMRLTEQWARWAGLLS